MTIGDYLRLNKRWFLHNGCLLILVNLVLVASSPLDYKWVDLLYFNILFLCMQIGLVVWDFRKTRQNFWEVQEALEEEVPLKALQFAEENYYTYLLQGIIIKLNKQQEVALLDYEARADQMEEYTTEWVHDIKVKVAVCDLVLEDLEEEEVAERLSLPIEQMKFMVNQLLYITRANHYSQDLHIEQVDVKEVIKGKIKENAPFFIRKNIAIENQIETCSCISDKKWLEYIVGQVLNNASKYTHKAGKVLIYTIEDEEGIHLHVRDNGVGVPKEELGRLFEKGFTGTNGRQTTKSTGMGLYYAKKMANVLSVGLRVESVQNEYTDVILSFYKLEDYFNVTKM